MEPPSQNLASSHGSLQQLHQESEHSSQPASTQYDANEVTTTQVEPEALMANGEDKQDTPAPKPSISMVSTTASNEPETFQPMTQDSRGLSRIMPSTPLIPSSTAPRPASPLRREYVASSTIKALAANPMTDLDFGFAPTSKPPPVQSRESSTSHQALSSQDAYPIVVVESAKDSITPTTARASNSLGFSDIHSRQHGSLPDQASASSRSSRESWPLEDFESPVQVQPVPNLQYHHQSDKTVPPPSMRPDNPRASSTPDLLAYGNAVNRRLTPIDWRSSSMPRPLSTFSQFSDRGRRSPVYHGSHHMRGNSSAPRLSPNSRPSSYAELLKVPYPQPAPAPILLDNSQLRTVVGGSASLLSSQKTLEMYRQNVKKTTDLSIQYSFAIFLIASAQEQGLDRTPPRKKRTSRLFRDKDKGDMDSSSLEEATTSPQDLVKEAKAILTKLATTGYPFAQYYLADGYASGLFSRGVEDYNSAFPLFVLAAKHGHAEAAYRTGLCYEFGWGCRKEPIKAAQFLRTAASKRHPGAMTRLGKACLSGDLGEKRYREGIKWLKLATESADTIYNAAPYQLACLYETGYGDDIFKDESYAAELFTQAADLGHSEANYRMGHAYEHGKLTCPRDPALSVHFYTGAAERGHAAAMMGLCAWYMVGAPPVLDMDEEEAFEWALKSAQLGFVKAQFTVAYFTEMGIGCRRDILEANVWYVRAADAGEARAKHRLGAIRAATSGGIPMEVGPAKDRKLRRKKQQQQQQQQQEETPGVKSNECKVM